MEPLLIKYAGHDHFPIRFKTDLVSAVRRPSDGASVGPILCTVKDLTTSKTYTIRTTFLLGADGGYSAVARAFPFHFLPELSHGVTCNVPVNMDLTDLMHARASQIRCLNHEARSPGALRRRAVLEASPPVDSVARHRRRARCQRESVRNLTPTSPELIEFIKEMVGDYNVEIEVLRLDPWVIRETVV
jgi:hypothetical protein